VDVTVDEGRPEQRTLEVDPLERLGAGARARDRDDRAIVDADVGAPAVGERGIREDEIDGRAASLQAAGADRIGSPGTAREAGPGYGCVTSSRPDTTTTDIGSSTPRDDGFAMPAEWTPHQLTLMAWLSRSDGYTRPDLAVVDGLEACRAVHTAVANAVAEFEPVLMLVPPEQAGRARAALSARVELLEAAYDDMWMRDNGPIFVTDARGQVALVHFGFNGWGGRYPPWDRDARVPELLADHFDVRRYGAPMVLEGGSFFVDGEGTLLTTEQCLLNRNRNPHLSRAQIEQTLAEYLGAERCLWLGQGHHDDFATDGHVDGIAGFVAPGRVVLHAPSNPAHPDHARGRDNAARLAAARDARGRRLDVVRFDTAAAGGLAYLNLYLCNGGVVVPVAGSENDEVAVAAITELYPDRELVTVPAAALFAYGGGGPHCVTQQVPAGTFTPR
jgi:agmatine deiminase